MLTKFLPKISELFINDGIKCQTMSDICRYLRISKKTLYQYVDNKQDLVNKSMNWILEKDKDEILKIENGPGNAIDKIYSINHLVYHKLKYLQPSIFKDLQKHFPDAWKIMYKYNTIFVTESIKRNLEDGTNQGLFRKNMNIDIIARINVILINSMLKSEISPINQHSFIDIYQEITKYHLGGICNPEGLEYLNKLLDQKSVSI